MTRARWLGLGFLAAVVIAGSIWALTPATRFVVGSVPSGDGEAILLTRRNDDASWFWVELVAADGTLRWSTEITPVEGAEALGYTGATATTDAVLVLGTRLGEPSVAVVLALSRSDGHPLWETTLSGAVTNSGAGRIGPMLLADAERAFVVNEVQGADGLLHDRIDVLSLATGAALWESAALDGAPYDYGLDVSLIGADRLLVSGRFGSTAVELDRASGAIRRSIEGAGFVCRLPDRWIGATRGGAVAVPIAAGEPVVSLPIASGWRVALNAPCGARGDDLIVGLASDDGVGITRLDPATGLAAWHLPLATGDFAGDAVLDGPLPRFLPVVIRGAGVPRQELVVVDLDEGRIADRVDYSDSSAVLVSSGRAWLWLTSRAVLVAVDPDTGRLAGATAYPGASTFDARAEDIREGQLWIMGSTWARPADLPWVVVDLETGHLSGSNGGMVAAEVVGQVLTPGE